MMNQVGQGLGVMFGFGRTKIWHASSFYLTARSSYCNSNSQIQFHNSTIPITLVRPTTRSSGVSLAIQRRGHHRSEVVAW
jgi:hypothetical protein